MKKIIVKANNIIIGKEVEVNIIDANYNETSVEVKIVEGQFKGACAIVNKNDIVKYEVELTMEEQVVELCEQMGIDYSNGIQDEIVVEGFDYIVYIRVDEETKTFDMSTLNTNVDWDAKEAEDIYFDMSDAHKNQVSRKTLKAVKNYIERYVG